MVEKSTPTSVRPGTPWEFALEKFNGGQEADLIYKRVVFSLTGR